MKRTWEAWEIDGGFAFFPSTTTAAQHNSAGTRLVRKLFEVEAETGEEAAAIYNLRMGWGAYHPAGKPAPCPKCGAWFYPEGYGECWRCGKIC